MIEHSYSWGFPLNSDIFNEVLKKTVAPGVYSGFLVTPAALTLSVNISAGVAVIPNGTVVWTEQSLINAAGIDTNPDGNPRIDTAVIEYVHGSDPAVNRPRIRVLKGDSAVTPVPPAITVNQLPIADILIPAGSTTLDSAVITQRYRVTQVNPGLLTWATSSAAVNMEISADGSRVDLDKNLTLTDHAPLNLEIQTVKNIMNGQYWGTYTITHTRDIDGFPQSSEITFKDKDENDVVVYVVYSYNDHKQVTQRAFSTTKYQVVEDYTYDPILGGDSEVPDVSQTTTIL